MSSATGWTLRFRFSILVCRDFVMLVSVVSRASLLHVPNTSSTMALKSCALCLLCAQFDMCSATRLDGTAIAALCSTEFLPTPSSTFKLSHQVSQRVFPDNCRVCKLGPIRKSEQGHCSQSKFQATHPYLWAIVSPSLLENNWKLM